MIEENGLNIVIDTGPDFRTQILREHVANVDAILFTHEHKDHTAGLDDIRSFNYLKQRPMDVYAEEVVIRSLKKEFAYVFAEKKYPGVPQIEVGFRIGDFTYITDANYIPEQEKEKIAGTRYLVISGLRKQKHISHFSLGEAIELINEFSPKRGYITHISHQMGLYEEVSRELPPNVILAYDGLKIEF